MSVNLIIQLLLSLLCWPKVVLLRGGHCSLNPKSWSNVTSRNLRLIYEKCSFCEELIYFIRFAFLKQRTLY